MASSWLMVRQGERVVVRFQGKLNASDGAASAEAFARELAKGPTHVTWDLRSMAGYETEARVAWQRVLWPQRHNFTSVLVVGGGPLVRLGAITLATALGVPITFRDEVPAEAPAGQPRR